MGRRTGRHDGCRSSVRHEPVGIIQADFTGISADDTVHVYSRRQLLERVLLERLDLRDLDFRSLRYLLTRRPSSLTSCLEFGPNINRLRTCSILASETGSPAAMVITMAGWRP